MVLLPQKVLWYTIIKILWYFGAGYSPWYCQYYCGTSTMVFLLWYTIVLFDVGHTIVDYRTIIGY